MGSTVNIHNVNQIKAKTKIFDEFVSFSIEARTKLDHSIHNDYSDTSYFLPLALGAKALRIAAAINEIMAGNDSADAPLVEAIASDTFTPLGEVAATVVAGLTPEADVAETLAAE